MGWRAFVATAAIALRLAAVAATIYPHNIPLPRENASGFSLLFADVVGVGPNARFWVPLYVDESPLDAVTAFCREAIAAKVIAEDEDCVGSVLPHMLRKMRRIAERARGAEAVLFGDHDSVESVEKSETGTLGVLHHAGEHDA
jgi:hypothetical protein